MSVRLSARARPASASRRTQFPQHGRIQPCRAQASIPTKANTLDKGPYILGKATRGFSTLVKVFSTREWMGSSTHITQVRKRLENKGLWHIFSSVQQRWGEGRGTVAHLQQPVGSKSEVCHSLSNKVRSKICRRNIRIVKQADTTLRQCCSCLVSSMMTY